MQFLDSFEFLRLSFERITLLEQWHVVLPLEPSLIDQRWTTYSDLTDVVWQ